MPTVLYIHGFLSSPLSVKARQTGQWLAEHYPELNFLCPELSSYPMEMLQQLDSRIASVAAQDLFLIGSSLGGFWATHLIESGRAAKAVLVNPAVVPHTRFTEFLGKPLKSYYSEKEYLITDAHLQQLAACDHSITQHEQYWVLLQTGDEVLDYRLAEEKYAGAKIRVEQDGNHSFVGYEALLPDIVRFFGITGEC